PNGVGRPGRFRVRNHRRRSRFARVRRAGLHPQLRRIPSGQRPRGAGLTPFQGVGGSSVNRAVEPLVHAQPAFLRGSLDELLGLGGDALEPPVVPRSVRSASPALYGKVEVDLWQTRAYPKVDYV